ncbi:MAG: hypothetical protein O2800_01505 [Planctomycetota bacterium]|nr:hypothetical protein [Planctomycetota bacterium]
MSPLSQFCALFLCASTALADGLTVTNAGAEPRAIASFTAQIPHALEWKITKEVSTRREIRPPGAVPVAMDTQNNVECTLRVAATTIAAGKEPSHFSVAIESIASSALTPQQSAPPKMVDTTASTLAVDRLLMGSTIALPLSATGVGSSTTQLKAGAPQSDVVRAQSRLSNFQTILLDTRAALPAEAIGVGAQWTQEETRTLGGVTGTSVTHWVLVARDGTHLALRFERTITFPSANGHGEPVATPQSGELKIDLANPAFVDGVVRQVVAPRETQQSARGGQPALDMTVSSNSVTTIRSIPAVDVPAKAQP